MDPSAPVAPISQENVRHVALLSRLEFSDAELERFTSELNTILAYVDQLNAVDTSGVPPTSHAIRQTNVLRDDEIEPSLSQDAVLANAAESEHGCFKVPRIIQE